MLPYLILQRVCSQARNISLKISLKKYNSQNKLNTL